MFSLDNRQPAKDVQMHFRNHFVQKNLFCIVGLQFVTKIVPVTLHAFDGSLVSKGTYAFVKVCMIAP